MSVTVSRKEVLLDITRKEGEHLRFVFTKATTEEGQTIAWHSLELGDPTEDGEFRQRRSISVRGRELLPLLEALHKAYFGCVPPGAQLPPELSLDVEPEKIDTPY